MDNKQNLDRVATFLKPKSTSVKKSHRISKSFTLVELCYCKTRKPNHAPHIGYEHFPIEKR